MRILSMTATFGKLEGATLKLEPGLNLMEAPNEWGKSTWCAFLLAMLYGVDTRQRTKAGTLADKEHYKPWSGKPMEGSLRVLWQGRDITIQRRSRGRIPMGEFRAFETDSGLDIKELTAENCGLMLLGVERSVYSRSGFITGRSLEVTEDPELRKRLNLLVTTGQDSPEGLRLETKLRELSRACEHRSSGALPETRRKLEQCRRNQEQLEGLSRQALELRDALRENQAQQEAFREHLKALDNQKGRENLARVEEARATEAQALELERQWEEQCRKLPSRGQTERYLRDLEEIRREQRALELEMSMTPSEAPPEVPAPFWGMNTEQAMERARQEDNHLRELIKQTQKPKGRLLWLPALLLLPGAGALALLLPSLWHYALVAGGVGALCLALWLILRGSSRRDRKALEQYRQELSGRYRNQTPLEAAEAYHRQAHGYETRKSRREALFATRRESLEQRLQALGYEEHQLLQARAAHKAWADARRDRVRASHNRAQLEAVAGDLPRDADAVTSLTLSRQETEDKLTKLQGEFQSLHTRLEVCAAKAKTLPGVQALEQERQTLEARLRELERWQKAIDLALEQLQEAQARLRQRFAPRISREAGVILSALTEGRYNSLLLKEDFTLFCQGQQEAVAREALWRSTGTEDQIYLALRLAVSHVLVPEGPLVLYDAMARFDRQREQAALDCLKAMDRQVIVFRCK